MNLTLQDAKERVSIETLWREFGYEGEPKKQCRCPFHEDRTPSFSLFDDGKKWKCHAGCGEGTVIDFLALAKGISEEQACREILDRAGGRKNEYPPGIQKPKPKSPNREPIKIELPETVPYSQEIAQRIADSRGLKILSVEFAHFWLKTIVFARVCEEDCWVLTDDSRRCGEARRIDAKPFPDIGTLGERKSHTLAGSSKSWPVGILPAGLDGPLQYSRDRIKKIVLVEGGPDYLAACQLIAEKDTEILPVAMLGASLSISEDALPYFAGRKTIVVAHSDDTGRAAGLRWAKQIQVAEGTVRLLRLISGDLCDAVSQGATNEELRIL